MKTKLLCALLLISQTPVVAQAENETIKQLLQDYASQGAAAADAEQGRQLWQTTNKFDGEFAQRSCASCHTQKLGASGKHIKTGKLIEPMAPSVNPQRLSDSSKIEKWFKRNCKWTLGRECSAQEKANILVFINDQKNI
jgi:hypothetical protein